MSLHVQQYTHFAIIWGYGKQLESAPQLKSFHDTFRQLAL
jgi:hypothetical protein